MKFSLKLTNSFYVICPMEISAFPFDNTAPLDKAEKTSIQLPFKSNSFDEGKSKKSILSKAHTPNEKDLNLGRLIYDLQICHVMALAY